MNDNDDPNQGWNAPPNPDADGYRAADDYRAADAADAGFITLSDLLGTTSRVLGAHFGPLLGMVLIAFAPGVILSIGSQEAAEYGLRSTTSGLGGAQAIQLFLGLATLGVGLLQIVLQYFAQAAVGYATVELIAGRRASVGQSLAAAFTHAWPILALAVLNSLAIGFGMLVCLIPGFILMCVLFASVPAAVVERLGPIETMQRSADLTRGHRVTIFLAMVVVAFVYGVIAVPLMVGIGALGGTALEPSSMLLRFALYGVQWLGTVLFYCVYAVLAAVFYTRARGVRDGVDADEIARVFA